MGIFKNITKTLKQAAPFIGSAIGMYLGGPAGAALGSGIGSLAAGRDAEEALKAAALAGGTAYLSGYGKGFKKMPSDATADARFFGGSEVTDSPTVTSIQKAQAPSSFFDKAVDFAKSGPGIATLGGLGTLALLGGEEEDKATGSDMPAYPVGKTRLGYGRIGDKFYNLDDEEERKQYFEDRRKERKDNDDDEVVTMRSGGLQLLGERINRGLHGEIKDRVDQIQPFLDQVGDMAQQKFGVDITKNPVGMPSLGGQLGSLGPATTIMTNQLGNRLPTFTDDMANRLFEAGKNQMGSNASAPSGSSRSDIKAAYMPIDQGEGIDQFGKPMETTDSNMTTDPTKALELFGNAFNRGVSTAASSPFGAGQSRLGGIGAIGSLFMNNGGEVNGPGTGTSDSVPARLSDGEFVLTAKAVRGAGGGDRDLGAARMYDMMSSLERVA
jgi:hypothetical protein